MAAELDNRSKAGRLAHKSSQLRSRTDAATVVAFMTGVHNITVLSNTTYVAERKGLCNLGMGGSFSDHSEPWMITND